MENTKKIETAGKIVIMLKEITNSECKIIDNTYLEKLLSFIESEFSNEYVNCLHLPELLEWLFKLLQNWKINPPSISVINFVCQFCKLLCKNEQGFNFLKSNNTFNDLMESLQQSFNNNISGQIIYIKLLSDLLSFKSSYDWVKNSQQWKTVIRLYFSNSNLYLEREGLSFIKKLIKTAATEENLCDELLKEVLYPISKNIEGTIGSKRFYAKIKLTLKLLEVILKEYLFSPNNTICSKFKEFFSVELFVKSLMEHCEEEYILEATSQFYVMFLLVQMENKLLLLSMKHIPGNILEVFFTLVKQNHIESFIKLSKFCQILWSEMRNKLKCESKTGIHFIILQLVPILVYYKKPPDTKLFDLYVQKLFALTSESTQKLGYCLRDVIRSSSLKSRDWAIKGVLSAIGNLESLQHEEAVLIFQTMAHIVKGFIPDCDSGEECQNHENSEEKTLLSIEDEALLSTVLNALYILIEKFKINWRESLESLCLLKITCILLQNPNLPSIGVVQTLLLVKLAILNFMSPNLALLLNHTEDSGFECLMPLLYKRMHDPNWEVRDSCIEVVSAIAELAESKYPAFQQLLMEKDFCFLVFDIMKSDSESYVRASALRSLSAMSKIKILNQQLLELSFPSEIIKLLQIESEGIVRREAALLVKQIYLNVNDSVELSKSLYKVMGYTAICDLHWEVKVNSLIFWETVIQHVMANQGMIDGSFPKVTFSKEHKKIVTLTHEEIKVRLDKVLHELSKIGCLFVLLTTLHGDCDFPVVKKSAQILTDLVNLLKKYDVISPVSDRIPMKRKNTNFGGCEKRKPPNFSSSGNDFTNNFTINNDNKQQTNSDSIIEEIVNELDINLLVEVCHQSEEKGILEKEILLHEIKPDTFLTQMQGFDPEKFLEDRAKWFINVEVDVTSLLNDTVFKKSVRETNIMDCY